MKNFKENPITTILGVLFVMVGFALLFIILFLDVKKDITLWHIAIIQGVGILLTISEDDMKDVIKTFFTLGINKLLGKKGG